MIKLPVILILLSLVRDGLGAGRNDPKTCYDGYVLGRNNLCIQEIDEDPHPACPAGVLDGKGCRVQIPKIKRCTDGYTLDATGTCSYSIPTNLQYFCPAGFHDNGDDCMMSTPGATTEYCDGGERVGDQCVRMLRADPIVSVTCPEDAILEEGRCWRTAETFDCTDYCDKTIKGPGCDKKQRDMGLPRAAHLRLLSGDEPELVRVSPPKQFRIVVVTQGCAKRYEVPTVVHQMCPEDFVLDTKGCFKEEVFPLKIKCTATGGPAEDCPPIIRRSEKLARCPDGSAGIKGKCTELVIGDAIEYCPSGFVENGDVCEGYIETVLECGSDLLFKNGRCIGKRTHQPVLLNVDDDKTQGGAISTDSVRAPVKELRDPHHTATLKIRP